MPVNSEKISARNIVDAMPEAFVSSAQISKVVHRRIASGQLRKLASRLYTSNLEDSAEVVVRRNLWSIVAGYFPGAVVADRTALEFAPASDGSVCLVAAKGTDVELPGIVLRVRRGAPPQEDDQPFMGQALHLSSPARTYLDNLCPSRARAGRVARTLSRPDLETHLERLMVGAGIEGLNRVRDDARRIAPALDRIKQQKALDRIIGALAGTREADLSAPTAQARARGRPYDSDRVALFEDLAAAVQQYPEPSRPAKPRDGTGHATLAFFEAYFSNYIEGTEFTVEEAEDIVFKGHVPQERPADAHDIVGVWRLVSDPTEMRRVPSTAVEQMDILRRRHVTMMQGRQDVSPGQFKRRANRAGSTMFVAPEAVRGTLERGFAIYLDLPSAFNRAVFMHGLVTEVHPFADGNGRLARIMMNAELVAANEERIVIPTVYRGNYIAALRALSAGHSAEPAVRMLAYAQCFTDAVDWAGFHETVEQLRTCHAFEEETSAEEKGVRLQLPADAEALPIVVQDTIPAAQNPSNDMWS